MKISDEQLKAVTLSEKQKLEVFRSISKCPKPGMEQDAEEAVRALKVIEIQGGRQGLLKRVWRWIWG